MAPFHLDKFNLLMSQKLEYLGVEMQKEEIIDEEEDGGRNRITYYNRVLSLIEVEMNSIKEL